MPRALARRGSGAGQTLTSIAGEAFETGTETRFAIAYALAGTFRKGVRRRRRRRNVGPRLARRAHLLRTVRRLVLCNIGRVPVPNVALARLLMGRAHAMRVTVVVLHARCPRQEREPRKGENADEHGVR